MGVQEQLKRSYCFTCTPGPIAVQFDRHVSCTAATVDTVVLGKFQTACISKITVELTTFLPYSLTNVTEGIAVVLQPVTSNAAALILSSYLLACMELVELWLAM